MLWAGGLLAEPTRRETFLPGGCLYFYKIFYHGKKMHSWGTNGGGRIINEIIVIPLMPFYKHQDFPLHFRQ